MNLHTYRCGCGKIEHLPNLKARPGPCKHVARVPAGDECGPWRPVQLSIAPGWAVQERLRRDASGVETIDFLAQKPKRRDIGIAYLASREYLRGHALATLTGSARVAELRYDRAAAFLWALRGLVKQINFAVAGGMRSLRPYPWQERMRSLRSYPWQERTEATNFRCRVLPAKVEARAGSLEALRACATDCIGHAGLSGSLASVEVTDEMPGQVRLVATFSRQPPDPRALSEALYQALVTRLPVGVALGVEVRCTVELQLAPARSAEAMRQAAAVIVHGELARRGFVAQVHVEHCRGVELCRVRFQTEEEEDNFLALPATRVQISEQVKRETGLDIRYLWDAPGY